MPITSNFTIPMNKASDIVFTDGETFQEKYNNGEFTGPPGAQGPQGDPGPQGKDGTSAWFGVCDSSEDEQYKSCEIENMNFEFQEGLKITIQFTNGNTVKKPYLSINERYSYPVVGGFWSAGSILDVVFDGTNWVIEGQHDDENGLQLDGDTFKLVSGEDVSEQIRELLKPSEQEYQVYVGEYTGEGAVRAGTLQTYISNKILDLPFDPKMIFITKNNAKSFTRFGWNDCAIWVQGMNSTFINNDSIPTQFIYQDTQKRFAIGSTGTQSTAANYGLNQLGESYSYYVIG